MAAARDMIADPLLSAADAAVNHGLRRHQAPWVGKVKRRLLGLGRIDAEYPKNVRCSHCGETGHNRSTCGLLGRERKEPPPKRNTRCGRCGHDDGPRRGAALGDPSAGNTPRGGGAARASFLLPSVPHVHEYVVRGGHAQGLWDRERRRIFLGHNYRGRGRK